MSQNIAQLSSDLQKKMLKSLIILSVLVAVVFARAQEPPKKSTVYDRTCAERVAVIEQNVKTAFSTAAYTGQWFEVRRYQQDNEAPADCMTSAYTWSFLRQAFDIRRTGIDLEARTLFTRQAEALLAFPEEERNDRRGILNVTYYADREADQANYYVLGTDYYQYVVGWGCEDIEEGQSREFAWVHSRTPELPEEYDERVNAYIEEFLDADLFRVTEQADEVCLDLDSDPATRELRMINKAAKEGKKNLVY